MINRPNCNRCDNRNCRGPHSPSGCTEFQEPYDKFPLVELAITYANSLNKALSQFPDLRLSMYLKENK